MRRSPARRHGGRTVAAALGVLVTLAAITPAAADGGRLVAVGDIHGEYEGFVGILRSAGLVDEELRWIGGETTMVQTGDFLDRGRDVRRVMDLLMSIQRQAKRAGGEVIVLQGNHEQLNLVGELRPEYVTPDICATFADQDSETKRAAAYRAWRKWLEERPFFEPLTEAEWNRRHPPGYFEYVEAIGPDGAYGKWIRTLPTVAKVGSTIFVHGGIGPEYVDLGVAKINRLHREAQRALDEDRRILARQGVILPFFSLDQLQQAITATVEVAAETGTSRMSERERYVLEKTFKDLATAGRLLAAASPLWYRGYNSLTDEELAELVSRLDRSYRAKHYVVAHSVQSPASIRERLGAVFLIDTGMLASHYRGRASALEIEDGRFTAIYPDDRSVLVGGEASAEPAPADVSRPPRLAGARRTLASLLLGAPAPQPVGGDGYAWSGPDGEPLPFASHGEITSFLANAVVVAMRDIDVGVTKPKELTLELGGVRARAAFRDVSVSKDRQRLADGSVAMHLRDSYRNEVAAYELGRLLGITNIPPAVLRTVDGVEGSVQLWVEGTMREKERVERGLSFPDSERYRRQFADMTVFDALINNIDRNQTNILWDGDWNLWMIDHTRAFGRDKKLHEPEDVRRCSRRLHDALRSLDPRLMESAVRPYMGSFEAKALTRRHRALLELLDDLIASRGEDAVLFDHE